MERQPSDRTYRRDICSVLLWAKSSWVIIIYVPRTRTQLTFQTSNTSSDTSLLSDSHTRLTSGTSRKDKGSFTQGSTLHSSSRGTMFVQNSGNRSNRINHLTILGSHGYFWWVGGWCCSSHPFSFSGPPVVFLWVHFCNHPMCLWIHVSLSLWMKHVPLTWDKLK